MKGQRFEVHFVDYGNHDQVSGGDLHVLTPNFAQLPTQAVQCKLTGVQCSPANPWGPSDTDPLWNLTSQKNIKVCVLPT